MFIIDNVSPETLTGFIEDQWKEVNSALHISRQSLGICIRTATGGKIVGGAIVEIVDGAGHLKDLIVAASHRRGKAGAFLIQHIEKELRERGINTLYVRVPEILPAAIRFYLKNGYAVVGEVNEFIYSCKWLYFKKDLEAYEEEVKEN